MASAFVPMVRALVAIPFTTSMRFELLRIPASALLADDCALLAAVLATESSPTNAIHGPFVAFTLVM
jgi:hypothetical protein